MKQTTPTYKQQVSKINEAARFFALRAFQVETTFHMNCICMALVIYFYQIDQRKSIEGDLRRYADNDDSIEFHEHKLSENSKFYTLRLTKFKP